LKRALITGITGQDGSYLAELLVEKGYEVHGLVRRSSSSSTSRIDHLLTGGAGIPGALTLHAGDLLDAASLRRLVEQVLPDEVYHLGAQSDVAESFRIPEYTFQATGLATFRLLEALRSLGRSVRFYQAGSSEMFGAVGGIEQDENCAFRPRSPYAIAKVFSHQVATNYREAHGMFCSNGIVFNHESPRRGENFVTRKITLAVARIVAGKEERLRLGNVSARRDWGYAPEYVEAMWRILQHDVPEDFVIATGETHSVEEFAAEAFDAVGLDWREYVDHDERLERPADVERLQGNAGKAKRLIGWEATTRFRRLVRLMVEADLRFVGVEPEGVLAEA
jgi:GDPmannose 4,6-dehydratase